jgi:Dockerin type I domain/Regulator of chromosome condensation (RCC1) repeat
LGLGDSSDGGPIPAFAISGPSLSVGAGQFFSCAESQGGVKCWGANYGGQLGNGAINFPDGSYSPVEAIDAGSGVTAVAAGGAHVCAIVAGAVKCWGENSGGGLGNGNNIDQPVPVSVNLFPASSFTAAPGSLTFSSQVGVTSAAQTITITNAGNSNLTFSDFSFAFSFPRASGVDAGSCAIGTPVPAGGSCTIGIVFTPTLNGGTSGTLFISHNAPGGISTITFNGTGTPPPIALTGVVSRKDHGLAGTFDLPIDTSVAIGGAVTVESRIIGAEHRIVFAFSATVTVQGNVTLVNSAGQSVPANLGFSANEVIVSLPSVPDNSRVFITLTGVNGSVGGAAAIGFLVGDANNTRSVNSSDISAVKARSGQTTTASNFKFDVNASGAINSSDISAVKARSGLTLP